ncbi:MAG TPA: flagellar basal body-associated FliL family protein [Verrucomicrobiae bacterium]|nr:flagellar basal body-associated FliL family protein [Verrucomicrobiae bacterium]
MANRVDNVKAPSAEKGGAAKDAAAPPAAAAAPEPGGIKPFIPLIANLVLMPVLAYVMTAFVLVPRLAKKAGAPEASPEPAAAASAHGESAHGSTDEHGPGGGAVTSGGKLKYSAPLSKKTLVNVSGTMGTRYLLAEFILVGNSPNLKDQVLKSDAELRDAAASALASKTIADLEKPGIRNLVRSELITIFNSILGKNTVSEIYLTEFAIQ